MYGERKDTVRDVEIIQWLADVDQNDCDDHFAIYIYISIHYAA